MLLFFYSGLEHHSGKVPDGVGGESFAASTTGNVFDPRDRVEDQLLECVRAVENETRLDVGEHRVASCAAATPVWAAIVDAGA